MAKKASGFILIYVIGILIFLGIVGLGIAYTLRINAQLVMNEKEALQNEQILKSAVQYTQAQLIKGRLAEPVLKTLDPALNTGMVLWKLGGTHLIRVQEVNVEVTLEDAGDLPDVNALTKEEIQRIFRALGAAEIESATLAGVLVKAREMASAARGGPGFETIQQVLELDGLPYRYRYGVKREAGNEEQSQGEPPQIGLAQWVTVLTGTKTVNLNQAPLQIVGVLVNAEPSSLARFDAARKVKALTLAEAIQILGPSASSMLREGASSTYRIRLKMERFGRVYGAIALTEDGGAFKVISYRNTQPGNEQ